MYIQNKKGEYFKGVTFSDQESVDDLGNIILLSLQANYLFTSVISEAKTYENSDSINIDLLILTDLGLI